MPYHPEEHHRRSIRLKSYDYSLPGAYFITICTQNHTCMFGEVLQGEMRLNDPGRMVEKWWHELKHKFPTIRAGEFVLMPNHFHGIIYILNADQGAHVGADLRVGPLGNTGTQPQEDAHEGDRGTHAGAPLPEIVQWFKTMTTNEYIRGVKGLGWLPFPEKLWQRNYYEHIARDDTDLARIQKYISNNPQEWELDLLYPGNLIKQTRS